MRGYNKYKDSSNEWIGEIPKKWNVRKLKYLAKIKNGKDQKEVLIEEGGYPVLGTGGEFGRASTFLYDKPSVLLGRKGTIDKPFYIEEPFWTVDTLFYTEIYENTLPKFLFYLTKTIRFEFYQESSAVPSMTQDNLNNIHLCHPSLEEQTQIVSFLDYKTNLIDLIIEKKKRLIELLKEKRQAVINEAVTKGINPIAPMRESSVKWLGKIPESWSLVPLRYLYNKIGSGVTPKGGGDVYVDEGVTFIRSQNVHFDGLRLDDVVKIDNDTHQKMNNSNVEFNDVLLNITGASIGRCCVVNIDKEMNVNQHVCIIRVNEKINPDYLNVVLQSNVGQIQIKLLTTGGNREGLTHEAVKNITIPLPNIETQIELLKNVSQKLNTYDLINNKILVQIEKLQTYRQSLIFEAVTGKIDVRDWQNVSKKA